MNVPFKNKTSLAMPGISATRITIPLKNAANSSATAYTDFFGTSASNTAYENSAIINALITGGHYDKIIIGSSATDTYLISQPITPNNIEIQYNCILKMMDSVTDPLAANILEDATTFTATDATKFHVGEFVAVTDDDQLVTYAKLRGWGGKITDITGNVITLDTKAPYNYTAANNGVIATLQSVILIDEASNVIIDQAGGYIDGNKAGQSLIHPTYKTTGVVEGYTQACGISVFKSSYITITDNVVVRNASMHGISFSSESTADLNQYLTIGAVHVYDSSEKGIHFKWTAHGTLGDAVVDTCVWEDGIMFYSTNSDWVVGDVTTINCGRSGFVWNAASTGLTFSSVTTSGCTDFGFDCASQNVIGGSVITSDRVRFNQTSPTGGGCKNVVIDSIAITGSISAITTPTVWLYGGIDGVTIGSLTLNGCTGIGIRASVLSLLYPQNVVVNGGGIYTNTGALTDIQVGSDVTLTGDFT